MRNRPATRRDPRARPTHRCVAIAGVVAVLTAAAACAGTSDLQVSSGTDTDTTEPPADEAASASTAPTTLPKDCASMLPPAGKAAQLLMVMVADPTQATDLLTSGTVGGIGLLGNQRSDVGEQISTAVADTPLPPIVAVDEEGGSVQRLRYSAGRIPSAADMAEEGTPEEAAATFAEHSEKMESLGIDMVFAPVADVGTGSGLDTRTYGDDPVVVGDYVVAISEAIMGAGLTPVVKHWPGIGSGDDDPHESLTVTPSIDELRTADLLPFQEAFEAGVPAVMVTHAVVPGLTGEDEPASLSSAAITGELRGAEGFDGVVITDDLSMGAIAEDIPQHEAAQRAVAAGADIALVSGTEAAEAAHAQLTEAISTEALDPAQVEASVRRVLALKGVEGECFDTVAAYAREARLETETLQGGDGDSTTTPDPEGEETGSNPDADTSPDTGAGEGEGEGEG